jgi:hypothetical protein
MARKENPRYMGTVNVATATFPTTSSISADIPLTQGVNISVPASSYTLYVTLRGLSANLSGIAGVTFGYAIAAATTSPTIEFIPCSNINQLLFRGLAATSTNIGVMGV